MDAKLHGLHCYIYLRISADKEGNALGVERQEADCRALAAKLGLIVDRVFCDNDKTASTNHEVAVYRADYEEMMNLLESGPVRITLTYTRKRLTRIPTENERQLRLARFHAVRFIYVRGEALDLTVSANRKIDRIQGALDAGEAEDLQELIARKKLQDAREGKSSGGRRTYGYSKVIGHNPVTDKDICDPYQTRDDEVELLKEGKRRTLAGDSQFTIIRDWNARGLTTSLGGSWDVGRFKRTLLNESYVKFDQTGHPIDCPCLRNPETGGTRIHHDDRHRARWPHIFTRPEHDAMTAVFNGRDIFWSNTGRIRGRTYLLSGMAECGGTWRDTEKAGQRCGGSCYGQGKTYKTKKGQIYQRRYACRKWSSDGGRVGCCSVFRIAEPVELFVSEQVLLRFSSPEIARTLAPADNEEQMAQVVQTLAELQVRREQLAAEYENGDHELADYKVMMNRLRAKIDMAQADKKRLLSEKARSLAVPTDGGLREVWEGASLEWRASVIKLVVDKVIIHPSKPGSRKWTLDGEQSWNFDPAAIEIVWLA